MHISEGFLPPAHCLAWFAAATPFVVHGARAVVSQSRKDPDSRLLLGAAGAFTLVLSAIKLPSVTGSSSHPTGTGLGAVILKPPVMAVLSTIVLTFQALLLAHGGLTTLGANVVAMGVVGPWVGYSGFVLLRGFRAPAWIAVFVAMAAANLATYVMTAVQLALAYPDPVGGLPAALAKFLGIFALTQIPLAIAEGLLGVVVLRFLAGTSVADRLATVGLGVHRSQPVAAAAAERSL